LWWPPSSAATLAMKSILVPIDFSTATPRVLELAGQVAKSFAAEIHLIHVQELSAAVPPSALGYGVAGMPDLMPLPTVPIAEPLSQPVSPNEQGRNKLTEWQKEVAQTGMQTSLHEPVGDVVEEILRTADAVKAGLIVMGRHGHGAMYNLLVGSVTQGVLKRSDRPVLLVPISRS
jgi:nucleotide-binding universal stress UspA family protein